MGQGFGLAALWVEVWICDSADGLGGAHEFVCLMGLGLEVGMGEGVEAVGLSGFVVEVVVVVGLPI